MPLTSRPLPEVKVKSSRLYFPSLNDHNVNMLIWVKSTLTVKRLTLVHLDDDDVSMSLHLRQPAMGVS